MFDNKYKLNELKDLLHNNELFEEQTINGQFNKFTCELVDDTLTISRQYTDEEILLDKISQKNNLDIDNLANILEKRIYQNILNKLENDNNFNEFITNLISEEIDDIRAEIDDLK